MNRVRNSLVLAFLVLFAACAVPLTSPVLVEKSQATSPVSSPAWASLHLSGQLILISFKIDGLDLVRLDLVTGNTQLIFHAPQNALFTSAVVSPDGKTILIAYAPPPSGANQTAYTRLYLLPIDHPTDLQPIIKTPHPDEAFFSPTWSPDGKTIYASHFIHPTGDAQSPGTYTIDRVSLDGQTQEILKDAQWPSISPDNTKIAYLSVNSSNSQNELYVADINGDHPTPIMAPGAYPAVDDHFFTPDGKSIIFSAVTHSALPTPSMLDQIFGVEVVSAHNVPSDWFVVSLGGGAVRRLTDLNDTGMYAARSPDGSHMAFISQTGLYVINLDGSELTQLSNLVAIGTVDWIR